jgi:hypothetical protein
MLPCHGVLSSSVVKMGRSSVSFNPVFKVLEVVKCPWLLSIDRTILKQLREFR